MLPFRAQIGKGETTQQHGYKWPEREEQSWKAVFTMEVMKVENLSDSGTDSSGIYK